MVHVPYFADRATDYVYKANISVYGRELSGIVIAKMISDSVHRVVFTTEFGNKLIDMELSDTYFKMNSIVSELDKKLLVNTLKTDFRLLLRSAYKVKSEYGDPSNRIYKSRNKGRYLFVSTADNKLQNIIHSKWRREKINLAFTAGDSGIAERIVIKHHNIKLKIELNYFKR